MSIRCSDRDLEILPVAWTWISNSLTPAVRARADRLLLVKFQSKNFKKWPRIQGQQYGNCKKVILGSIFWHSTRPPRPRPDNYNTPAESWKTQFRIVFFRFWPHWRPRAGKAEKLRCQIDFFKLRRGCYTYRVSGAVGGYCAKQENMCPKRMFAKNIYELALKAKCPNASRGRRIGMQVCRSALHFILNRQMDTKTIVSMLGWSTTAIKISFYFDFATSSRQYHVSQKHAAIPEQSQPSTQGLLQLLWDPTADYKLFWKMST